MPIRVGQKLNKTQEFKPIIMTQRQILSGFLLCLLVSVHVWEDEDQNSGLVNLCLLFYLFKLKNTLEKKPHFLDDLMSICLLAWVYFVNECSTKKDEQHRETFWCATLSVFSHSRDRASHNDVIGTTHLCMSKISAPGGEIEGKFLLKLVWIYHIQLTVIHPGCGLVSPGVSPLTHWD